MVRLPAGLSLSSSSRKSQWAEEAPVPSASKTRSRERAAARGEVLEGGEQWIPLIIRMAASSLMQIGERRRLSAAGWLSGEQKDGAVPHPGKYLACVKDMWSLTCFPFLEEA